MVALRGALFEAFAAEFPKRRHSRYQIVVLGDAVQGNGGGRPIRQLVVASNARKVVAGRIGVKPFVPAGKLGVGQFPHDTTRGQGINEINTHASAVKQQCHPCQAGACRRYDVDKLLAVRQTPLVEAATFRGDKFDEPSGIVGAVNGEFSKRPGIFQEREVFIDTQFGGPASQQYLPALLGLGGDGHEGCADTSVEACRCRHESG